MSLPPRNKKQLIALALAVLIALFGGYELLPPSAQGDVGDVLSQHNPGSGNVVSVSDGDTIIVREKGGTEERVRLIGVDTPEKHHPSKPVQCFAQAATDYTAGLIGSNSVRLEVDPQGDDRDRYGRLLRYVYLPDGTLLNKKIIEDGYGFAYTLFSFEMKETFLEAERTAREQGRGLWSSCQVDESAKTKQTNSERF